MFAGDDRRGDGRPERAALRGAGDPHLAAGHVGVDLHEHRVLPGDAAGADDAFERVRRIHAGAR